MTRRKRHSASPKCQNNFPIESNQQTNAYANTCTTDTSLHISHSHLPFAINYTSISSGVLLLYISVWRFIRAEGGFPRLLDAATWTMDSEINIDTQRQNQKRQERASAFWLVSNASLAATVI